MPESRQVQNLSVMVADDPSAGSMLSGPPPDPMKTPMNEVYRWWYPSWSTWKARRTLTYWIAIMFGEGSLLFTIGGIFALSGMTDREDPVQKKKNIDMLVTTPYATGAVAFSIGAYCGVLHVANIPRKDLPGMQWCFRFTPRHFREIAAIVHWQSLCGYLANFIGAIAFNIDTLASYKSTGIHWLDLTLTWGMATIGGIGFTVGGFLECQVNELHKPRTKPKPDGQGGTRPGSLKVQTSVFWLCIGNFVGGICFLIAGVAGLFEPSAEISYWLVDFVYCFGSLSFLMGAFFMVWMWKNEKFGLGFLPEINLDGTMEDHATDSYRELDVTAMSAEYGCGKSSVYQLPWLFLYQFNACASIIDVTLAIGNNNGTIDGHRIVESTLNFALSHGILLLGSVIHHVPTARPFNWLLIYMRIVLFFYTANSWYSVLVKVKDL